MPFVQATNVRKITYSKSSKRYHHTVASCRDRSTQCDPNIQHFTDEAIVELGSQFHMIKLYFWVCWTVRKRMASPWMQAGRCIPPPWGTIKTLDLQRAHFSTAKTTPPLVIMSPETRSDYLSSWCNSEPCSEAVRQKLHGSTKRKKWWE